MPKRFSATEKWSDPWFRKLPIEYKSLFFFLIETCDHAGIWKVDHDAFVYFLGKPFIKEDIFRIFNDGKERIVSLNCGSKWLIKDFVVFQYGELNPDNKAHASVISILEREGIFKGLASPLQGAKDKDTDKDTVKDKDKGPSTAFKKPTIEEIREYCIERKNLIDPEYFFNKYESTGWVDKNGNKMKNWKATIVTWEKWQKGQQTNTPDVLTPEIRESLRKLKEKNAELASNNR